MMRKRTHKETTSLGFTTRYRARLTLLDNSPSTFLIKMFYVTKDFCKTFHGQFKQTNNYNESQHTLIIIYHTFYFLNESFKESYII